MKILILANNDVGLYNFRKELIEKLLSEENEVLISLPYGKRVDDLKNMGCKYIETEVDRRGTNPIKDFKLLLRYKKMMREIKPDIVLTYTIKPNIYGGLACSAKKIPYICNITGLGPAAENASFVQKLVMILYKKALKKVKCCFVQNEENLRFMLNNKLVDEDKCKLIPGSGVNLDKFKVLPYPEESDKIRFLFISRIMKEKGIEQYLDTAKAISQKYPNTEFHILGFCEQEYDERLKEYEANGYIKYHGMQNDIIPFMKECSCLIHPSYYPEGMSNVLLEASASGRPVITTNRSGCKEVVDDNKTGFVVTIKDSEAVITAVEKLINLSYEERKNMGLSARKKVEKEFDRKIVVNNYMEEINKLRS